MRSTWVIAKRELSAYFTSSIAYVVLAMFALLGGYLFFDRFFAGALARMDGFFAVLPMLYLFFAPAIAMRLLAEERNAGTIELLLTLPVRDREVVLGKYVAALVLLAAGLVATLPFAVTVAALGELDAGPVVGGYLGALLLGGLYLAAALAASALARNQVVALIGGLVVCSALLAVQQFVAGGDWARAALYASPQFHYANFMRGVIELRGAFYFLSAIAVFLIISVQVLEARRWR